MKYFTSNQKANGEMAVRKMSQKAQRGYNETDPMVVYKKGDKFYIEDCGGLYGPLTFEECQEDLEGWVE